MTVDELLLTLRVVTAGLALLALGGWCLVSAYRWPHFDTPDRILCIAIGVLLFTLFLAFSIKAADGAIWMPVALLLASLAGLCAALGYRLKHKGDGHIGPQATP